MKKQGFTLIELMVTVTIMLIMTSIIFFNYNKFNDSTLLNSFAYDMSLTIRQAQIFGVAVREAGNNQVTPISTNSVGSNFVSPYGVHFDQAAGVLSPFLLFVDSDKNRKFDNAGDSTLQSYTFQRGIKLKDLVVVDAIGSHSVATLDITFVRPDPEAVIRGYDSGGNIVGNGSPSSAQVVLQNSDDSIEKIVEVDSTGQISVQNKVL
jgi:prepilin-type N-terminal cleavage/methylation domain-containing protein